MQNNPFYKFYQKSLDERKEILFNHPTLTSKAKEQQTKWSKTKLKYTAYPMESFQN